MASSYNVTDISLNGTENASLTTADVFKGHLGYEQLKLFTEYQIAYFLNLYYLRVLSAIGVVCNAAVFFTIYSIKPYTTSSFYVAFLAVIDALALIMKLLYSEITRAKVPLGDAGCAFMAFFGNFTVQFANWVLVIMTLERFVAVWFPLKVNQISTMRKAKVVVFVTAVILAAFNLHFLWTLREGKPCGPGLEHLEFMMTVWPWLDAFVFGIAPCLLLIVPNGLIIYSLRRAIAAQKKMTSSDAVVPSRSYHQTQLTAMLVTVAVASVCCLMPGSIFFIVKPYWDITKSLHQRAQYMLVDQITFFLADCNHALNFFFFFLGGKRFRKMFIDFVLCRTKKQKRKSSSSTYISRLTVKTPSTTPLSVSSTSLR